MVRSAGAPSPIEFHRFGHDDEIFENADGNDDVLEAYRQREIELHDRFAHDHGVFVVEFLGSTGSATTSLIERLIDRRSDPGSVGVVVSDVAGDDDDRDPVRPLRGRPTPGFESHPIIKPSTGINQALSRGGP
jgi:hypothetical protein